MSFSANLIFAHHPPDSFDHTIKIGNARFCVRCLGILSGSVIKALLIRSPVPLLGPMDYWFFYLLFPGPAILDFCFHETGRWKSHNLVRFITGLPIGMTISFIASCLFSSDGFGAGLALLSWMVLMEFLVAAILKKAGALKRFINSYEEFFDQDKGALSQLEKPKKMFAPCQRAG